MSTGADVREDEAAGDELDERVVPPGVSLTEYLSQRHDEIAQEDEREPLTIEIPLWRQPGAEHSAMAVQFDYPEQGAEPIIRAGFRMQKLDPKKAVDAALDVVLGACKQVVGRRPEDADWQPLDPHGDPVKFGNRLAALLKLEVGSEIRRPNRYIARNLWSPRAWQDGVYKGDLSLVAAAGEVTQWLQGIESSADEVLEGE